MLLFRGSGEEENRDTEVQFLLNEINASKRIRISSLKNAKRMQEHKELLRLQRRRLLRHEVPDWTSFCDMISDLRIVEKNWAAEFGELPSEADTDSILNSSYVAELDNDEDEGSDMSEYTLDDDDEEYNSDEYTSDEESEEEFGIDRRCQRELSTRNSYMEEDRSRRMLEQLRIDMYYVSTSDEEESMSDQEDNNKDESAVAPTKLKKMSKRKNRRAARKNSISDNEDDDVNIDDIDWLSKRQRKKRQRKAALFDVNGKTEKKSVKERRQQRKTEREIRNRDRLYDFSKIPDTDFHSWGHFCDSCSAEYTTKNRLLAHLKKSGHNSYIPDRSKSKKNICDRTSKSKKNFYRRKN